MHGFQSSEHKLGCLTIQGQESSAETLFIATSGDCQTFFPVDYAVRRGPPAQSL